MTVIYQPKGRAREYAADAANLYKTCPHGCAYCYVPTMPWGPSRYDFHKGSVPKKDIITQLRKEAPRLSPRQIHLCFTCDPYPCVRASGSTVPQEITHEAVWTLKNAGHTVQILTKGGLDSTGDFSLLDEHDEYATTLTFSDAADSRLWEPHAALPADRIEALKIAHSCGITTWASLEPVVYPEQSFQMLIHALEAGVSKVKVGPLNYKGRLPKWLADTVPDDIDWKAFVENVQELCRMWQAECILKDDMKKLAGLD